ncbi:glycosyltransferase family 2 protein [Salinimicrobium oceani]|uniref:Glycosyltransferase family 2 protein n=1 Tax=Salinimicrobium oceani TaxID=2722702 RepID=A0ABX1D2I8_9FLAO|nr:glycosyltransferase family 2 protein [Salinimicrobium oceani]NJW53409.1 glycosyltransferase family 2 protein [Salinimicrobium oceani]
MNSEPLYQSRFVALQCCVLIPTYNNHTTLKRVLNDVLEFTRNIIVVNDGSTDATKDILSAFSDLHVINLPVNKGKGNALKTGFKAGQKLGFDYAISMDSDGQHFADDLDVFLQALENHHEKQPLLVIGSRKMDAPGIPEKSSIGNKFSSFWYWVETGIKLQDTQCGYRLYPLPVVNSLHLFTSRFELEIEVIVKAAWKGVVVKNLPVKVLYDPQERVTHFRPWQDVARITLLNIIFVFAAAFYIAPRNLLRKLGSNRESIPKTKFSEEKLPLE